MFDWNFGLYASVVFISLSFFILLYILIFLLLHILSMNIKDKILNKIIVEIDIFNKYYSILIALLFLFVLFSIILFFPSRYIAINLKIKNEFINKFKNDKFYFCTTGNTYFLSINPTLSKDKKFIIKNNKKIILTTIAEIDINTFINCSNIEQLKEIIKNNR